ncbi:Cof-type HAD-IIB family hydrolase [Oceanivirga miroungae]|uniref:Cof family hydrolase n=1 Tax=Oceanivirga miroungae TaxID=1130046 RepID=A0A6I8M7W3_9FUSO|nr:Cof-type HAD-IIB family hydrolase [Oceanivirga miroungae]VWL85498.1 cof family hydrolase [Oceanivirga miroungae]
MYNTVISDLDGTLLGENHDISEDSIKLLNYLNKKGVRIILATGRNYVDAKRIAEKLDFTPELITSNGAELTNTNKETVFKKTLDSKIVEGLINLDYKKYDKNTYLNLIEDEMWSGVEAYKEGSKMLEWQDDDWKFYVKEKKDLNINNTDKVFYISDHDKLVLLLEDIKKEFKDSINYAFTLPFCLEIFPNSVDKSEGLKELSKINKVDFENAIAFGDGYNDVNMLKLAKKAYIMGNAPDSLKKELKELEVVDSNANEGLQKKLKEIYGIK